MTIWIAAKNRHTGGWSTGGTLDDYPAEHWERFRVPASDRTQAEKLAKALRQKHRRLTAAQRQLLKDLIDETIAFPDEGTSARIEVKADERRAAERLAVLGLIDAYRADGVIYEASLTPIAWNHHDFAAQGAAA